MLIHTEVPVPIVRLTYFIGRLGENSVGVGVAVVQLEVNLLHIRGHVLVPAQHNKISPEFFITKTSLGTDICPPRPPEVACSFSHPDWIRIQLCGMFRAGDSPLV